MMSGNPNWWSINSMYPQSHQLSSSPFVIGASSNPSSVDHHHHNPNQDFPIRPWSQLLLGGHGGAGEEEDEEEEKFESSTLFQLDKKLTHWDNNPQHRQERTLNLDVKQEGSTVQSNYSHHAADDQYNNDRDLFTNHNHHHQANASSSSSSPSAYCWPINTHHHHQQQVVMPPLASSPTSCITSLSNNSSILNFSAGHVQNNKPASLNSGQGKSNLPHNQDHERNNSSSSGGVAKKARVQQSSAQPALKVRKEKLGDRITALHQLVSPFGKTDTASVLSEAIGYIGFLQGQIEALSSPYMRRGSGRTSHHQQHSVQGRNSVFHEAHSHQQHDDGLVKDLRSRGLCLVPISCTQNMTTATDNGSADYWAQPALGGGGGF